jgi:hypothetical protein
MPPAIPIQSYVPPPPPPREDNDWSEQITEDGVKFYWNSRTEQSSW